MAKLIRKATACWEESERCIPAAMGERRVATAGAVIAPRPRAARLVPSWQLERKRSRRDLMSRAARSAMEFLELIRRRVARAPMEAYSAATKNAFSATSVSVARILIRTSMNPLSAQRQNEFDFAAGTIELLGDVPGGMPLVGEGVDLGVARVGDRGIAGRGRLGISGQ